MLFLRIKLMINLKGLLIKCTISEIFILIFYLYKLNKRRWSKSSDLTIILMQFLKQHQTNCEIWNIPNTPNYFEHSSLYGKIIKLLNFPWTPDFLKGNFSCQRHADFTFLILGSEFGQVKLKELLEEILSPGEDTIIDSETNTQLSL